ncbi:Lrp/AsnC family leucine-responsive transcriptional regulator [Clostridium algifaecis]|uniref:Lrp/AsnC family leucine-responsive transcriptional regulator n=1 Tax=Clostridium algifaecis TaxID=1472040 RepID=A0ABS4KTG1_9CLOT|nr:Lrp/AsnC family transcriptional regulator [Clostridium algifaecis]MBP2033327.1 Lrp/AsnC family leucine-responsive transcriptional regulator [Clostridium algifaecis]
MDETDLKIINILIDNSNISYKEIGKITHMTGQAVGIRINNLIDQGIIEKFTIKVNSKRLGISLVAIAKIYMKSFKHQDFLHLLANETSIVEAYKVTSDACYYIKIETTSLEALNNLMDRISLYGNYQVSICGQKIK